MLKNTSNFILDSDLPIEMITYVKKLSVKVPEGAEEYTKIIPHNLGYTPLTFGVWSYDKDFTTSRSFNDGNILDSPYLYATNDHIEVNVRGIEGYIVPMEGKTIYMNIYGFAPDKYIGDSEATQVGSKPLILNTDYPYLRKAASLTIQPGCEENGSFGKHIVVDNENKYVEKTINASSVFYQKAPGIKYTVMAWGHRNKNLEAKGISRIGQCDFEFYNGWYYNFYYPPNIEIRDKEIISNADVASAEDSKRLEYYVRIYVNG